MKRYVYIWFMATALILALVAAINTVVDPYGIFRWVDQVGFNRVKPAAAKHGHMAKAYQVLRIQPKTLILGNSRAEVGLDPNHAAWPQNARPVYNAALPGTGTATSLQFMQHVLATDGIPTAARPTLVLWGLDFMDFLTEPTAPPVAHDHHDNNAESLRLMSANISQRWRQQLRDYAESTLTLNAALDSVQTLASQHDPYATDLTAQGFNPMRDYIKITADEGYWSVFRQKDVAYNKSFSNFPKSLFDASGTTSKHWEDLKEVMRLCRQNGIELRLFTYPYHASMHEIFRKTGHAPGLELWRRRLVEVIAEEAAASGQPAFRLWDFSQINARTAEAVPAPGDRKSTMQWYWEAGHFKSALGGLMLEQMLGKSPPTGASQPKPPANMLSASGSRQASLPVDSPP